MKNQFFPKMDQLLKLLPLIESTNEYNEEFYELLSKLDFSHNQVEITKIIADSCKQVEPRNELCSYIPYLIKSLTTNNSLIKINTLRALANLSYNHDQNRDLILNTPGSIKAIINTLEESEIEIVKIGFGAILNISMDNELVQISFCENSIYTLFDKQFQQYFNRKNNSEQDEEADEGFVNSLRVLGNILESDLGLELFFKSNTLIHTKTLLTNLDSDLSEFDLECLDAISVCLETIAEHEQGKLLYAQYLLDSVMDFVDQKIGISKELVEIKMLTVKTVTLLTMNDVNMKNLCTRGYLLRFVSWCQFDSGDALLDDDCRMSGALCIGNLARSDDTCVFVIGVEGVFMALKSLLLKERERLLEYQRLGGQDDKMIIKVIHAVLGAIKNLSLAGIGILIQINVKVI
jgi:ribosomal protein S17E